MKGLSLKIKNSKIRAALCAVLGLIAAVCIATAVIIMPARDRWAYADIKSEIESAVAYSDEKEITISANTNLGLVKINPATTIRIKSGENVRLNIDEALIIPAEAHVILDVETQVNAQITVEGTLTVNDRLYNQATVKVKNVYDANAEIPSKGLIICGSFNNDAAANGKIEYTSGATVKTEVNSFYTADDGETTKEIKESGTLMLKGANGLALVTEDSSTALRSAQNDKVDVRSARDDGAGVARAAEDNSQWKAGVVNEGSIIYDNTATKPTVKSGNAAVAAKFIEASTVFGNSGIQSTANASYSTFVIYKSDTQPVGLGTANTAISIGKEVNLLSFGKVTYKFTENNKNFSISANVSLGGGTSDGIEFTQGANELIFDGGAVWGSPTAFTYGNITKDCTIFYDNNNSPYIYTNSGKKSTGTAFFKVTDGGLSLYGGTKITKYENATNSDNRNQKGIYRGGGVYIASGKTLNVYGGEISWCGVTGRPNAAVGAGIYNDGGTVNMYHGAVTHNAAASNFDNDGTANNCGSADGAGVAVLNNATFNLFDGEISFNHAAVGGADITADGGGLMLDNSTANIYGGEIRGNFAGGVGGGICAWNSELNISGGSITKNRAANGGGIGTTANSSTTVNMTGGSITDNEAFQNYSSHKNDHWGGYGGGICLGADQNVFYAYSSFKVSGNAVISGNKAYYGGGLAVYTGYESNDKNNQLIMEGGLITGNAAYELKDENAQKPSGYFAEYNTPSAANGGGVFVYCKTDTYVSKAMLVLSGEASIDSSNTVSFNVKGSVGSGAVAPIHVGKTENNEAIGLTGSGLGALVYLNNSDITSTSKWRGRDIIGFESGLTASNYLNKFVLDNDTYSFAVTGNAIRTQSSANNVAQIKRNGLVIKDESDSTKTKYFSSLAEAVNYAQDNDVIEILQSATISGGKIDINKNLTIQPAAGKDVTLVVASDTNFGSNNALFNVTSGAILTLNGDNGTGSRLTIDGNGNGRKLANGDAVQNVTLINVNGGGQLVQDGNVYLRNNVTTELASAVRVSGNGDFTMKGGVIENNSSTSQYGSAVYLGDSAKFNWNGGVIGNNLSPNAAYNYGVYLSSNNNTLKLNKTPTLTDNVIYLGAAQIIVEKDFSINDKLSIELADITSLQAGKAIIHVTNGTANAANLDAKFNVVGEQDGLSIGTQPVTHNTYSHDIVVFKTTTYVLDSTNENGEVKIDKSEIHLGDITSLITTLTREGAVDVKKRDGGYSLAIKVRYNQPMSATGVRAICDYFTRDGYTLMGWGSFSYESSLAYNETYSVSSNPYNLNSVWQEKSFEANFDANAPKGKSNSAVVAGGTLPTGSYTYSQIASGVAVKNDISIVGFAFAGWWTTDSDGNYVQQIFTATNFTPDDFTATTTRGTYRASVKAKWIPIFKDSDEFVGIGTVQSPFLINTVGQLENLRKTVAGETVAVDGITYVNTEKTYSGFYFKLIANLEYNHSIGTLQNPFGGIFDGNVKNEENNKDNFKTITLNGSSGLFGYLSGATISNLIIKGTVSGSGNIGAVANTAKSSTFTNVANEATVTSTDGVAGGIVAKMEGGRIESCYNHGTVNGVTAGGIIGVQSGATTVISVYNTGSVGSDSSTTVGGLFGSASNMTLQSAFNGGAVNGSEGENSKIGAIAGTFTGGATSFVYYNTDKTMTLSAFGAGTSPATALTSSRMYVSTDGNQPAEMQLVGNWTFEVATNLYYYPQLRAFAENEDASVKALSQKSVTLTVKEDSGDKPLEPTKTFTVTYYNNFNNETYFTSTFTFGANDSTGKPITKIPQPTNDPTRVGYVFGGWYTDRDGTNIYDFDSGVPARNIELYAKWDFQKYLLGYESGGGTFDRDYSNAAITVANTEEVPLIVGEPLNPKEETTYAIVRRGYYFVQWNYTYFNGSIVQTINNVQSLKIITKNNEYFVVVAHENGEEEIPLSTITAHNQNKFALTPEWKERTYEIKYEFYKVVGENTKKLEKTVSNPNATTYTILNSVPLNDASLEGYTFKYWTTDLNGGDEAKLNSIAQGSVEDKIIYGVFAPVTYKIYFNERDGGDLLYDGTKVEYESGEPVEGLPIIKDDDTGLYYAEVLYGEPLPEIIINGNDLKITAQRVGYHCNGWYLTPAGTNKFIAAENFNYARNITLYASYTINTYTVNVTVQKDGNNYLGYFDKDELEAKGIVYNNSADKVYEYTVSVEHGKSAYDKLVTPKPELQAVVFSGWDNIDKAIIVEGDVTVTAKFAEQFTVVLTNTYISGEYTVVTFNNLTSGSKLSHDNWGAIAKAYEIDGYTFEGWYTLDNDGTRIAETFDELTAHAFNGAQVLFARYRPVPVEVKFEGNDPFIGGDGKENDGKTPELPSNLPTYNYGQQFGELPTPTYIGYNFVGWYLDKDCTGTRITSESKISDLAKGSNGYSITLYAKWEAISYTINYNFSGGAEAVDSKLPKSYTYADTYTTDGFKIPATGVTREGYTLTGWIGRVDEQNIIAQGSTGDITLTASWDIQRLTVTFYADEKAEQAGFVFDENVHGYFVVPQHVADGEYQAANGVKVQAGGKAVKFVIKVGYGYVAQTPVNPVKTGHSFDKWSDNYVNVTEARSVTPKFTPRTYKLYLSANNGAFASGATTTFDVTFGTTIDTKKFDVPTLTGYDFAGWYDSTGENGIDYGSDTVSNSLPMPANDLTLFARWTLGTYTVTINCVGDNAYTAVTTIKTALEAIIKEIAQQKNIAESAVTDIIVIPVEGNIVNFIVNYTINLESLNKLTNKETSNNKTIAYTLGTISEPNTEASSYNFFVVSEDTTVTAWWEDTSSFKTVTFIYKYGESGTPVEYKYRYANNEIIKFPTFKNDGYDLIGWTETENGTEPIKDITNIKATKDITYYAILRAATYKLTYEFNGGHRISDGTYPDEYKYQAGINISNAERSGYVFGGWYTDAAFRNEFNGSTAMGDLTLYAKWTAKRYNITVVGYQTNSGTQQDITVNLEFGGSLSELLAVWNRDFFTVKLYFDAECTVELTKIEGNVPAFDEESNPYYTYFTSTDGIVYIATVYAKYTATEYDVNYYGEAGTTEKLYTGKYTFGSDRIELGKDDDGKDIVASAIGKTQIGWEYILGNGSHITVNALEFLYSSNLYYVNLYNGETRVAQLEVRSGQEAPEINLFAKFDTTKYTVTFNANAEGISGTTSTKVFEYGVWDTLSKNGFTRVGYDFVGWATEPKGTLVYLDEAAAKFPREGADEKVLEITLYALWTAKEYTIIYDLGGGTISERKDSVKFAEQLNVNKPIRYGYTLKTFTLNGKAVNFSGTSVTFDINATFINTYLTDDNDTTLVFVAEWEVNTFNVTFDANGGKFTDNATFKLVNNTFGEDYCMPEKEPTRLGYIFAGWDLPESGKVESESAHTIYAKWTPIDYTVIFDFNGGSVDGVTGRDNVTISYNVRTENDKEIKNYVDLAQLTKEGYNFLGWKIKSGNGVSDKTYVGRLTLEQILAVTGSVTEQEGKHVITLVAQWEEIEYTITYITNGGNITSEAKDYDSAYTAQNTSIKLPQISFTGYDFGGWYEDSDFSVQFSGSKPEQLKNLVLYAKWDIQTFTVTISAGEGKFKGTLPTGCTIVEDSENKTLTFTSEYDKDILSVLYAIQNSNLELPVNKNFLVWKVGNNNLTDFTLTEETTITATYSDTQVSITFVYLDGKTEIEIVDRNKQYTIEKAHTNITGYQGVGWKYYDNDTVITNGTVTPNVSIVIQETGVAARVSVTFDPNGGSFAGGIETTLTLDYGSKYTFPIKDGKVVEPTYSGYIFTGWYYYEINEGEQVKVYVTAETVVNKAEDHTLLADWTEIPYTAIFELNGGNGIVPTQSFNIKDNTSISLVSDNIVKRSGYLFMGWALKDKGGNFVQEDGAIKLFNGTVALSDIIAYADTNYNLTFVAQWQAIKYTVNFVNENDTVSTVTLCYEGIEGKEPVTSFIFNSSLTKENYTFASWQYNGSNYSTTLNLQIIISDIIALVGETTEATVSLTFTAQWTPTVYTIKYDLDGGTLQNSNPASYTVESEAFTLNNPKRLGYTFAGWTGTGLNGATETVTVAKGSSGNRTYTAKWTAKDYTLQFTANDGENWDSIGDMPVNANMDNNNGTVKLPTPVRAGYTFAGWNIFGNTSARYLDSVQLINIITETTTGIEFVANWSEAVYTIDYVLNGGTQNSQNPRSYRQNEEKALHAPTRDNYEFKGWFKEAEFDTEVNKILSDFTGDITLYAKWERVNVEVGEGNTEGVFAEVKLGNITAQINFSNWTYGENKSTPTVSGELAGKVGFKYGVPKAQTAATFARRAKAREGVNFDDFDWFDEAPENAGEEYYLLIYYLFDNEQTVAPIPTGNNMSGNGWAAVPFAVGRAKNELTAKVPEVTYGDEWTIHAESKDEAAGITFEYRLDGSSEWTATKPTAAGKYFVKATSSLTRNYNSATEEFELNIRKKALKLTAGGESDYGDTFNPDAIRFDGFISGEDEKVLKGTPKVIVPDGKLEAGRYSLDIELSGVTADNYELSVVKGTYIVNPRRITATLSDVQTVYGAEIDLSGVTFSTNGLVSGDDLTCITVDSLNTTAVKGSNVGIYPITCSGYTSKNYEVTFEAGYYRIEQLEVSLVITANGGEYGDAISEAKVTGVKCNDSRVDVAAIESDIVENTEFTFVYAGATFENEVYGTPDKLPENAGVYYATAIGSNPNFRFTSSSVQFTISKKLIPTVNIPSKEYTGQQLEPEIEESQYYTFEAQSYTAAGRYPVAFTINDEYKNNYQFADGKTTTAIFEVVKAANGLKEGGVTINGWTYGQYDPAVNSPVSSEAKFGTVYYTYSSSENGTFTAAVPSNGNAGTYWVRAEVAGTNNYEEVKTAAVQFEIAQVVLNVPTLTIFTAGENKNDVYTGKDLRSAVLGFNSTLMKINYGGTLISDGDSVTVVARNANEYEVKFSLADNINYRWADGTVKDEEGNAVKVWTVNRVKVKRPTHNTDDLLVTGLSLTYIPKDFDESVMQIRGNNETFGGTYTATVSLKDTENFEWEDGGTEEIKFTWQIKGINKLFILIISLSCGLLVAGVAAAFVQWFVHKRKLTAEAQALAAAAENPTDEPPANNAENTVKEKGKEENTNAESK